MKVVGLSIIDRLLEEEGSLTARVRGGIRRDLEDLLNSNPRVLGWPRELRELDNSLLNFGIQDLATANLATDQHRSAVVEELGDIIRAWEPRLENLIVSALPNADPGDRSLRMRIEAQIALDPVSEPMIFDTIIDPIGNTVSLLSTAR